MSTMTKRFSRRHVVRLTTAAGVSALVSPVVAARAWRGDQTGRPTPSSQQSAGMPLPLTGERRAAFEAYVADALQRFDVPGVSIAVVQGGDVVYLNGFGVKVLGGTQPVDPDTMLMIGSDTKSMTTLLAATLVDD